MNLSLGHSCLVSARIISPGICAPSPAPPLRNASAVLAALEGLYRLLGSCAVRSDPAILCTVRSFFLCVLPAKDKSGPRTFLEGLEQSIQQRDPETCWPGCRRVEVLGNRVLQSTFIPGSHGRRT